ncbi:MAG: dihydrolipoyl dehydrogenase [Comamonadaceae bacterium]
MDAQQTKLLIIGGGPGGYVAAIRAAQLGIATTLVEADHLGGTCLNIGCIPSKALIHAADAYHQAHHFMGDNTLGIHVDKAHIDIAQTVRWKDGIVARLTGGVGALLKKHGVKVVKGQASMVDGKTVDVDLGKGNAESIRIQCEHLLLATGSVELGLPGMPFGGKVISSRQALSPERVPKTLLVVGAGYIGLELGLVYRKLGADVTVVEAQDRILPLYDEELTKPVANSLRRLGVQVHLGCQVQGLDSAGVRVLDASGRASTLAAEQVLVAIGRVPNTHGWGLEGLMLEMKGRAVKVNDQCQTSMRNVWAIGDLTGEPMLAHRAMAQGEMVAEIISGKRRHFSPTAIAAVCFTDPELVVAGQSPQEAALAGLDCIHASFPYAANGRAMTLEASDGFVRVVARRDNHLIVGWQAVGVGVSELSTAFSHSIEMGACLEDVAGTIHAHPTLGEAVQEAAMRALGHALHV